jgi:hypothetical protein
MHRWLLIAIAGLCAIGAGCDDNNVTAPSSAPVVFSALLSPANEIPAVVGAETAGRGAAQIQFNVTRGANGDITAATADFYFQLADFPAGTTVVGAHIHPAPAGVTGPVTISTGLTATNTRTLSNGTAEFSFSGIPVDPALAQAILNNPAGYYFNVHSPQNTGGFARGQLTRVQ